MLMRQLTCAFLMIFILTLNASAHEGLLPHSHVEMNLGSAIAVIAGLLGIAVFVAGIYHVYSGRRNKR